MRRDAPCTVHSRTLWFLLKYGGKNKGSIFVKYFRLETVAVILIKQSRLEISF